jgi:hypothetical protein
VTYACGHFGKPKNLRALSANAAGKEIYKELNGVGDNGIPRSGTGLRVIEEINARLRDIRLRCVHGVSLDIRIEFVFMRVTTLSCPERCLCSRILGRIYAG